ncbi:MAG: RND transporter [Bacteroidetes bacterium]|nr:MAG: RND transporter [Bacteroidota bacterium]
MKNIEKLLAGMLVTAALFACRVGKDYQRPQVDVPQQYRDVTTADTSSIGDWEWKKFFADVTLQQLISQGIAYNYDLQLAIKRMGIASEQVKKAKLLQLPQLDFQATVSTDYPSKNSLNGLSTTSFLGTDHINDYLLGLNLTWEADIWGKLSRQKESTVADYLQSYEATKAVQTRLVSDIAQAYFNLIMLDKQLDISYKNLALTDSTWQLTRLLRDAGEATTLAVQQAEVQKQTIEILIPQLQQGIELQENALQVLTGNYPGRLNRTVLLDNLNVGDSLPTGIPASILSKRPDVRASEMAIVSANAQVGVAKANMYPALVITAGTGLESFKSSNWFNIPNSLFGIAAGSIVQPVFRRRELKTQYEIAKIQREQAVIEFKQSILNAVREVSDALVSGEKLKEQQQKASDQVDTLNRAVANARLLFKSDMANYLEVITAQRNAVLAELNLATIQRDRLNAKVDLYRSLGGGWK